jgi:hypothetical protein
MRGKYGGNKDGRRPFSTTDDAYRCRLGDAETVSHKEIGGEGGKKGKIDAELGSGTE